MIHLKDADGIASIKAAGRILRAALNAAGQAAEIGVSTNDLDEIVRSVIENAGARPAFKGYQGFPGNSCISVNEAVVHGIPSDSVLADGDIVSIDIGVFKSGYYADACETFTVGTVSENVLHLLDVTKTSLAKGIEQFKVGNRLGDISHAVQVYAEAHGFSVVRDLVGHGIGRALHEDPQVPNFGPPGMGPLLRPGMVLAIEPMINEGTDEVRTLADDWTVVTADGKASAHFEHTVALTDEGPVILTI
ncbi:MAG: type I methionyl aminopeptidase [bacterium]|nr:type I methionyl aminopeptidase [bacterium]